MPDLIDTGEMYLKTVYELIEEGITPLRARIAERLEQSGPTVSQTVARLERDGMMTLTSDRHLELTPNGLARARRVMRKHRLAERLLLDVVGMPWPEVHTEACRWEHVMGVAVERRLLVILESPHADPYGNPIPGLAELGGTPVAERASTPVVPLLSVTLPATLTLARIAEPLQVDVGLLTAMYDGGALPGSTVTVALGAGGRVLTCPNGDTLALDDHQARHLFVDG